jgi:predicted Zn-dependent peptidase
MSSTSSGSGTGPPTGEVRRLAKRWFSAVPKSEAVDPIVPRPVVLREEKRLVLEDEVQLPRLYVAWVTPPAFAPADAPLDAAAAVLASGKNSRLYKRLVYELQVAQDVAALQGSNAPASTFTVEVTARAGHCLEEILRLVDEELLRLQSEPPTERETTRFQNQTEAAFFERLERVGGFGGKADQLNAYYFRTGNPDLLDEGAGGKDALALSDAVDFLGARLTTGAGWDASTVRLRVPVTRLREALPLMADVALRPDFPEKDLEPGRETRRRSRPSLSRSSAPSWWATGRRSRRRSRAWASARSAPSPSRT